MSATPTPTTHSNRNISGAATPAAVSSSRTHSGVPSPSEARAALEAAVTVLISEESQGRKLLVELESEMRIVAQLSELVLHEERWRNEITRHEEPTAAAELHVVGVESFDTALRLEGLRHEVEDLTLELHSTDLVISSSELLLQYLTSMSAEIAHDQALLQNRRASESQNKQLLADAQERLEKLPAQLHDTVAAQLTSLEVMIERGTYGDEFSEGDEAICKRYPNQQQLCDVWSQVGAATLSTSNGLTKSLANYSNVETRIQQCVERHAALVRLIDALFQNHEAKLIGFAEEKKTIKKELYDALQEELSNLEGPRKLWKQVEVEQQFHIRRGTFVKERQSRVTHDSIMAERVKGKHTILCDSILKVRADSKTVEDEVREAKRALEDLRRSTTQQADVLHKRSAELTKDAEQIEQIKMTLEAEGADLKGLKQDATRVLQFVKLNNKRL